MSLGLVLSVPEEGEEGAGGEALAESHSMGANDSTVVRGGVSEERDPRMTNRHESA